MKKLTIYFSKKTNNASMFEGSYANPDTRTFESAEEWFTFWQTTKMRVKRFTGSQFGDDNGRYSLRMAQNDFNKFAQ